MKGERFFGRMGSHDQKKRATMKTKQRNGEETASNTVGETGRRAN